MPETVLLAGATGGLGGRIAKALAGEGAALRVLVRPGTEPARLKPLQALGAEVRAVDTRDAAGMRAACAGAACVVSALSGLKPVIVDAQTALLEAAVAAGVPRFIPSDFSIDFTRLGGGEPNRNFDLRRTFRARVDTAPIRATSIFNGAFMDMITGQMPLILFGLRRVVYWGSADVPLDMTTMDDTAAFTAKAALDADAPRDLHIAGDHPTARDLAAIMTEVTGKRHRLLRAGSLERLAAIARVTRRLAPGKGEVFPAWQGMQYLHNMMGGRAAIGPVDNDRYPGLRWTSARALLARTDN